MDGRHKLVISSWMSREVYNSKGGFLWIKYLFDLPVVTLHESLRGLSERRVL